MPHIDDVDPKDLNPQSELTLDEVAEQARRNHEKDLSDGTPTGPIVGIKGIHPDDPDSLHETPQS